MSIMSDRFNRATWSDTRKAIDEMKTGDELTFPGKEYYNCHASVQRSNDAYGEERHYEMTGGKKSNKIVVRRTI